MATVYLVMALLGINNSIALIEISAAAAAAASIVRSVSAARRRDCAFLGVRIPFARSDGQNGIYWKLEVIFRDPAKPEPEAMAIERTGNEDSEGRNIL